MNLSSESHVEFASERGEGRSENIDNTKLKKTAIFWISAAVVLLILLTAVTIAIAATRPGESQSQVANGTNVCNTNQCVQFASSLLNYMDSSMDPCDDFYKFACGTFLSRNETTLDLETNGYQIKAIFEEPHQTKDSETLNMAKKYYKSCMTQGNQMQSQEWIHHRARIEKVLGDWPVLVSNWTPPDNYSWEKQLVHLIHFGVDTFLKIEVKKHPEKSAQNSIWLDTPQIPLNSFGFDFPTGINKEAALKDVRDIQIMKSAMDKVDWNTLFSIFPAKFHVNDNEKVAIMSWKQFKNTLKILSTSSKRVVQNYIFLFFELYLKLYSPKKMIEHDKLSTSCAGYGKFLLPDIVGAEYAERYTDKKQIQEVKVLDKNVRDVLIENLNEAHWLDDKTRAHALAKVDNLITIIGYPNINKSFIMHKYKNVEIKENNFFHNNVEIQKAKIQQNINSLRSPIQRGHFDFDASTRDAQYVPTRNLMLFTTAYIQYSAVSSEVPAYLNYARLGWTFGHEITHAFDFIGHKFDEHGNLKHWWTKATYEKFAKKEECFRNQFNDIIDPISGERLAGNRTLGENMADTGGMKLAYKAFMKSFSKHQNMPTLPGLANYTPEQLFFLTFANFECSIDNSETRKTHLKRNVHSLSDYRVNYSLKNLREFAEAFKCPKTAKMRIKKRCEMW